ncbi:hypothetical protein ETH_00016230 [Eimeria tenella]|uniref:Uncharacterized protein n=1 Tax=Eimeria tenella TaxID=5802 RepID=U6L3Z4_EIMTE|nr:hypothetical protein ETH_00016230 [Eimeria tenella]CDJ43908.1 hypothetical protein ETH_00016230 [Eimeria tenella]|eukprot:XP_013234657.1 hypothetical protein ETH_00016230 [Eimeria tenella]
MRRGASYGLLERHVQHSPVPSLKPPAAVSPEVLQQQRAVGMPSCAAAKQPGANVVERCSSSSKLCFLCR